MMNIEVLMTGLMGLRNRSRKALVQYKCKAALSDLRRARTLLEKAEQTYKWAQHYDGQLFGEEKGANQ